MTLKIAVVEPIPRPRVRIATVVKPALWRNCRALKRKSRSTLPTAVRDRLQCHFMPRIPCLRQCGRNITALFLTCCGPGAVSAAGNAQASLRGTSVDLAGDVRGHISRIASQARPLPVKGE